jgi:hypothetical protein
LAEHPSLDELQDFAQGLLPAERARRVVAHLLRGCMKCGAVLIPEVEALLPEDPDPLEDPGYDDAIDRAYAAQRWHGPAALKQRAKARKALALLEAGGLEELSEALPDLKGIAACEALLERSWALRHEDPQQMVELASHATLVADHLSPRLYESRKLADLRCRAWSALGNAYRVADNLQFAEWALERAAELCLQGTGDETLSVRLLDLQASLYGAQRRFPMAFEILDAVYAAHRHGNDHQEAGRVLIKKGLYKGYSNDPIEAVRLLTEGLAMIDLKRDPQVTLSAIHNIAWFLMEGERFRKARNIVWEHRWRYTRHGGKIYQVKLRWLQGRIEAGLGNLAAAETALREAREGLEQEGLGYHAALSTLDLANILLQRGCAEEARSLVLEATELFLALNIQVEAIKAVLVLRRVFETGVNGKAILDEATRFLRRIEYDPALTFSAWFL